MSAALKAASWVAVGTALLVGAVAAWHQWPMRNADPPIAAVPGQATGGASPSRPPTAVARDLTIAEEAENEDANSRGAEPGMTDVAAQWEVVKRYCTWPPEPSAWSVLDGPCLSAMDALRLDAEWRLAMEDPMGTRRAVVAALDDPQCHVPPGESRPDLHEACAAGAMVRLARLQRLCIEKAHLDFEGGIPRARARSLQSAIRRSGGSQKEYLRAVEEINRRHAYVLWAAYTCRSAMDALAWLEALPRPPGDLANAGLEVYDPRFEGREDVINAAKAEIGEDVGFIDYVAPRLTQDVELFALARRLGAKLPDWADWVPDDPASD